MKSRPGVAGGKDRGQTVGLIGLMLLVFLGMAGIAVDAASYAVGLRRAQNQADAIVLAAAVRMRDPSSTETEIIADANQWASQNGVNPGDLTCCTLTDTDLDGHADKISASVHRPSPLFFMRAFRVAAPLVERSATARVVHAASAPICPWGLVASGPENGAGGTHYGLEPNAVYALKVAADLSAQGNFRALDITGGGASDYRSLIAAGCNQTQTGMWQEGQNIFVMGQQGNLGESTQSALRDLYAYEASDGYDDSNADKFAYCNVPFTLDPATGKGYPVAGAQYAPPKPGCGSEGGHRGRILILPILNHLPANSGDPAQVLGLASMYLAGWDDTGPPAQMQVYGIFLGNATLRSDWLRGQSDNPLSPLRIILTE